jgi:hypothetical protein
MNTASINVQINFKQILDAVNQLSPSEKLELNEMMWNDNMPIPQEHQDLVLDRIEKIKENPARLLDWDEVSKQL